jgi:NADPH-dependent curcumin reductase CurA
MTAYFGLKEIGQPKAGETVVVSAASGAVGSVVGSSRSSGCRRRRHRGGRRNASYVRKELGFDACIDYKAGDLAAALKDACPKGVDVYFDNVGGEIFDTLLARMNLQRAWWSAGSISDYNASATLRDPQLASVLVNRIRLQGMIVFDWKERYGEALGALAGYFGQGRLKYRESVVEGLENAPRGLIALLKGENFGKQLVKLA